MADLDLVVAKLRAVFELDTAQWESGIRKVQDDAKAWSRDLGTIGRDLETIGRSFTAAFTLPIVAGFTATSKAAIDFESSFAGVKKTVEATDEEFAAMALSLRALAREIPINVNELNRLAEAAGALGIPKEEIVDFTRVMAMLGVTTNLTADQAADSIARIQNIFNAAGQDTENFASALVALGNAGASTESQILEMATRLAGAGNTIGLTQAEVLGMANALASLGLEAEAGGSAMSRVFVDIAKAVSEGGAQLQNFAAVAGMTSEAFAGLFRDDASAAIVAFVEGLGQIKTEGGDLIQTLSALGVEQVRLRDTLLRLAGAGDQFRTSIELSNQAWQDSSALSEEARKRFETTESQLTLLWNRIKDVGITIGNALLPMINAAIQAFNAFIPLLEGAANFFASLPMPIQAGVVAIAGLVAAIGPALWIMGQLATSASAVVAAFTAKGVATRALTTALPLLSSASAVVTTALSGLGSMLGPIVSAFGSWEGAIALVSRALGAIPGWGWAIAGVSAILTLTDTWDDLWRVVKAAWDIFVGIADFVGDVFTIAIYEAGQALQDLGEWISEAASSVASFGRDAVTAAAAFGSQIIDALTAPFRVAASLIASLVPDAVRSAFGDAVTLVRDGITLIRGYFDSLLSWLLEIRDVVGRTADAIRGGGDNLPALPENPLGIDRAELRSTTEAVQLLEQELGRSGQTLALVSEEARKHAEAIARIRNEITGQGLIDAARQMAEALRGLDIGDLAPEMRDRVNATMDAAIQVFRQRGEEIPPAIRDAFNASYRSAPLEIPADAFITPLEQIQRESQQTIEWLEALAAVFPQTFTQIDVSGITLYADESERAAEESRIAAEHSAAFGAALREVEEAARRAHLQALDGFIGSLQQLGGTIGGPAGSIISNMGGVVDVLDHFIQIPNGFLTAASGIAQGIAQVWQATEEGSAGVRALNGAMSGLAAGFAVGGPWGAAIGAGAGALAGYMRGLQAEADAAFDRLLSIGELQESLALQFQMSATETQRLEASLRSAGGYATLEGRQAFIYVRDTLADMGFTAADTQRLFDNLFDAAKRGQEEFERAVDEINDLLAEHERIMQNWADGVNTFIDGFTLRIDAFVASMADVESATEADAAAFDRMAQIAVEAFGIVLAQTGSAIAALEAIQGPLDALIELQDRFGFETSDTFARLAEVSGVVAANEEVFRAIQGLQQMMLGLDQATLLTQQDFLLFAQDATNLFDQLISNGVDANTAMALMQPTLQMLWELQQRFGIEIDASTQALLDQAVAAGIVGEEHRSINERILNVLLAIEDAILRLPGAFAGANAGARELEDTLARISRTPLPDATDTGRVAVPRTEHDGGVITAHAGRVMEPFLAHAGRVVGPFTRALVGDEIPVIAQAGEAFLNKKAVAAMGGVSGINAINAGLQFGDPWAAVRPVPSYGDIAMGQGGLGASGGRVGSGEASMSFGDIYVTIQGTGNHEADGRAAAIAFVRQLERGGEVTSLYRRVHQQIVTQP